jgi:predicted transcriptional regulator of viral defense system
MDELTRAVQNKDMVTSEIARKSGISKYKFCKFMEESGYEQIRRGMYAAKDAWVDELQMISLRCPQGVFSHDEAFYHYNLTDREPLVHTLTIYSGYNAHRLVADGCKVYTVKRELLDIGKTWVTDNCGNEIPMYNIERTICDLIRSRNSIEVQDFNTALKSYVRRKDKDLNKLMEYAGLFRVDKILRKYMECVAI